MQAVLAVAVALTILPGQVGDVRTPPLCRPSDSTRQARLTCDAQARWLAAYRQLRVEGAAAPEMDHTIFGNAYQLRLQVADTGWNDPRNVALLNRLVALRHSDGGWGIEAPLDLFGDGSVNDPVATSYTVTTADHVGPILIDAYRHGKLPASILRDAATSILRTPRAPVRAGSCVAYDNSGNDNRWCVHNVNLGAAVFLRDVERALGEKLAGADVLIAGIVATFSAYVDQRTGYVPYATNNGRPQDPDHNGYTLESAYLLGARNARDILFRFTMTPWPFQPAGSLASFGAGFARVVPYNCSAASSSFMIKALDATTAPGAMKGQYLHDAWLARTVLTTCFRVTP